MDLEEKEGIVSTLVDVFAGVFIGSVIAVIMFTIFAITTFGVASSVEVPAPSTFKSLFLHGVRLGSPLMILGWLIITIAADIKLGIFPSDYSTGKPEDVIELIIIGFVLYLFGLITCFRLFYPFPC